MIEQFEKQQDNFFEFGSTRIPLLAGERYLGTFLTPKFRHHTILLPGDFDPDNWKAQIKRGEGIGGLLPFRYEQALARVVMPEEFQKDAYWSCEAHVSDSGCAWYQYFDHGGQDYLFTYDKLRARFFRRLDIL